MSLIPFEICADAMFCSKECHDYGKDKYVCAVDEEFPLAPRVLLEALDTLGGDLEKLILLFTDPELSDKTVFDVDLSNTNDPNFKYNQLLAFNSLAEYQAEFEWFIKCHPVLDRWSSKRERDLAETFMLHVARRFNIKLHNASQVLSKKGATTINFGAAIFPGASIFNHSCFPNTEVLNVDNKLVVYISYPIKRGQQILISHGLVLQTSHIS